MGTTSARQLLVDKLEPLLPDTWRMRSTEGKIANPDTTYVLVALRSIQRWPAAPQSQHELTFDVTVVVPGTDFTKSEDGLGDDLDKLLYAIDTLSQLPEQLAIRWLKADKVNHDGNLAYEIEVHLIAQKETQPETTEVSP